MARRNHTELAFPALSIEGGLLAPDFLNRIAHLEAGEQAETDYDTPRGLKLRDEIGRYWKIAQNLWQDFSAGQTRTDVDTHALTVDRFLEPLLRHVLGFGDLRTLGQITLGERIFPIELSAGAGRVPIVVAGHDQPLDRLDARFGDGSRRRSPFLLAQEYLNATPDAQWAIVTNGLKLRILRDNPSLTRPAYIEADLEAIFNEGLYPDFTTLWLLAHASRFGAVGADPANCPLERWRNTAQEDGIRARDRLREGVAEALRALGTGFLIHPSNAELRQRLEAGALSTQGYFEQLLRLVYRFIFLATIEDRGLVFAPGADESTRERYLSGYSLQRLRHMAARRRSHDQHTDLWQGLVITLTGLGTGQPALGLPALGGLFNHEQCPTLDAAQLDNASLLSALFSLCFFRDGAALSRVNYRDMDSEELGSVYESLLELVPLVTLSGHVRQFGFVGDESAQSTRGNARKLSGSYYTPTSLVQELIKSALEPVIERTLAENPQQPVQALLSLSVCDPACGSGHFLLAAARRIAEEVARLNAKDSHPLPSDYRLALREVIARCIYGVDRNALAVELARTALWLEAYTPERPLTFLDSHLRCGDALLGILDPALLDSGIPDKAFNALSGDDKEVVKHLKKANREARKAIERAETPTGQFSLALAEESDMAAVEQLADDTLDAVEAKRAAWMAAQTKLEQSQARLAADLFVAAFAVPKTPEQEHLVPTSQDLWLVRNGGTPRPGIAEQAHTVAASAQAFHWWQAFPQIRARGGFDVLLGNPPWERIKLQEEEFFATRSPLVAEAPHKAERGRRIALLADGMLLHTLYPETEAAQGLVPPNRAEQALYAEFLMTKRQAEATSLFAHDAGRYPLTGVGDVNTYALFAETFSQLVSPNGRAGFIVPTGIATDDSTKAFFATQTQQGKLVSLYDIENREAVFPSVHRSYKFCLLTLGTAPEAQFVCFATQVSQLADTRRRFRLSPEDFALINPNTLTCPMFRSERDAELTKKLYRAAPVLVNEGHTEVNPWGIRFMAMIHMSNDSHLFSDNPGPGSLPLYEAKMIHQFDHRWASYGADGTCADVAVEQKMDPDFSVTPRYWVDTSEVEARLADKSWGRNWLMGWRNIARSTDERTFIASLIPQVAVGHSMPLFSVAGTPSLSAAFLANMSSLIFDFIVRQKLGGTNMTFGYFKQFPVLVPDSYTLAHLSFIVPKVLELTYTSFDMKPWAKDLGYEDEPFPWNPERRMLLRAELDAYYARLYGLTRNELRYILDPSDVMGEDYPSETFRVLKNNEMREFGEFRTQRLVLEAWDRLDTLPSTDHTTDEPPAPIHYSGQGMIQSREEAELAGLILALVAQHPQGCTMPELQSILAHAEVATRYLRPVDAALLTSLLSQQHASSLRQLLGQVHRILERLEATPALVREIYGKESLFKRGNGEPTRDVTELAEHADMARLLVAAEAQRLATEQAQVDATRPSIPKPTGTM
ncbi:DNA methyltransferase [Castellaniella sp. MT123]|uniref:Eco57I restriction-modification methylase domain-containing protein n=1 Tax=Castellaniella sp. MT123 TaxID=3140381 RepID=UPI0031F36015